MLARANGPEEVHDDAGPPDGRQEAGRGACFRFAEEAAADAEGAEDVDPRGRLPGWGDQRTTKAPRRSPEEKPVASSSG